MATVAFENKYKGGFCYAACQDLFNFYNPSVWHCRKGCDFGMGRVNNDELRKEAQKMCKRYTTEMYVTNEGTLDNLYDLRVHADMFPSNPENLYRACLAGIRRQVY
jgi:hypothetical protein